MTIPVLAEDLLGLWLPERFAPCLLAPEFLYWRERSEFLSQSRLTPILRHLSVVRPARASTLAPPFRVLVAVSPSSRLPLDLARECRVIEESWGKFPQIDVVFLNPATFRDLQRTLHRETFQILYFMGHGDFRQPSGLVQDPAFGDVETEGALTFNNEEGGEEAVAGPALASILRDQTELRLVFLNACESARTPTKDGRGPFAGVATALVKSGVPAVLAMQFPISDQAAIARWPQCERLWPHALSAAQLIEEYSLELPEASRLLNRAGLFAWKRAMYADAEPLYRRSLEIREKALGLEHPDVAESLNNLALFYRAQGRFTDAEPLQRRSFELWEKALEPRDPRLATSLSNLGNLYCDQKKFTEAEPLLQRSLEIREAALGSVHPDVAQSLNNLAILYCDQGRFVEAESLCRRSLEIQEKALGPNHPNLAPVLNNLAILYCDQGRGSEAEPLYRRSLEIREEALGPEPPDVATSLNNMASFYLDQGQLAESERLCRRSLEILEKTLGPEHIHLATMLNNYAVLLRKIGREREATEMAVRAAAIKARSPAGETGE